MAPLSRRRAARFPLTCLLLCASRTGSVAIGCGTMSSPMEERTRYWTSLAQYDVETAKAMLRTGRHLYVGFMWHQAVEKMLKAAWQSARADRFPPRIHNLERLASEAGLLEDLPERHRKVLTELEPLNVEARYPTHRDALLKKLTKRYCTGLLGRAMRLTAWIAGRL